MKNAQTFVATADLMVRIEPQPEVLLIMVGSRPAALVPYSFLKDQVIDDFEADDLQLTQVLEIAESFQDLADTLRDYAMTTLKPGADE